MSESTSTSWALMSEEGEKDLHHERLFLVEERPFSRITEKTLTLHSFVEEHLTTPPTPPPESRHSHDNTRSAGGLDGITLPNGTETNIERKKQQQEEFRSKISRLREEIIIDFAVLNATIARLQLLQDANTSERERYAADKNLVLEAKQAARESTAELRAQLELAKATLAQRRKFDELADKIMSSKSLKPRDEQLANIRKLEVECQELERESESYAITWRERREQFNRIVDEGMQLRRLIRDEKDDLDRREGMEDGEEEGETVSHGAPTPLPSQDNADANADSATTTAGTASASINSADYLHPPASRPLPARVGELSAGQTDQDSHTASRESSPPVKRDEEATKEVKQQETDGEPSFVAADKMDTT